MLATQAFLLRYRPLHEELIPELLRPLSNEQLRRRPHPHATPIGPLPTEPEIVTRR